MYPKIDRAGLDAALAQKKPKLKEVDLTGIDIRNPPVDFSGVALESCTLSNLNFAGLKFVKGRLKHCWTNGVSFEGTDFSGATLVGSFAEQKMAGAIFKGATLKKVELMSSDLRNADFSDADLEASKLMFSDVAGTIFTGANLAGVKWDHAKNVAQAIGIVTAAADPTKVFAAMAPEGGPVVALPSSAKWPGEAAGEGKVTVCGWVELTSAAIGSTRALLLEGELDTGAVPIDGGLMLIRGGDFDGDLATARKAAEKALKKKKGWERHAHAFESDGSGLSLVDANGMEDPLKYPLAQGSYDVDVLGSDGEEGPVVFVRLMKR